MVNTHFNHNHWYTHIIKEIGWDNKYLVEKKDNFLSQPNFDFLSKSSFVVVSIKFGCFNIKTYLLTGYQPHPENNF